MLNKKHFFFTTKNFKKKSNVFSLKNQCFANSLFFINSILLCKKQQFCYYTGKNKTIVKPFKESRHFLCKNINSNKKSFFFKKKC